MVGLLREASNAFSIGDGKSLNVDIVACGRHNEGFANSLKMFSEADRLRFIFNDSKLNLGSTDYW